jgi:predicted O-linked N-acetylglucosamine transferase (SPINDLY family)/Flp pilus assembly protein TadD
MSPADPFETAVAAEQAGRLDEAERICRQILGVTPQRADVLLQLGMVRAKRGDLADGLKLIRCSLELAPDDAQAHLYCGMVFGALGKANDALASYQQAIAIDPAFADAHYQIGHLRLALNQFDDALASFDRVIALKPEMVEARGARVAALVQLARDTDALVELDAILAGHPDLAWALTMRGRLHLNHKRYDEALEDCSRSLTRGMSLDALVNRARIFHAKRRFDEAKADIDRAVALDPNSGYARFVRGSIYNDLGRLNEALADFQYVVMGMPEDPGALTGLGGVLCALGRYDEALAAYNRAIASDGKFAKAYTGRGELRRRLGQHGLVVADFEQAAVLDPDEGPEASMRLLAAATICDWQDRASRIDELIHRIRAGEQVSPLVAAAVLDDPELHLLAARTVAIPPAPQPVTRRRAPHTRLRIAYLSPDFREHVLAHQIVELIERHDRARFEVYGISLVDWPPNASFDRLTKAFEHFVKAGAQGDRAIAELLAALEIDIAVDLAGYTDMHRARIFSYRPAPVAVSYLGYPGTTASENIDYILADAVTIPPENEPFFSERVVRLPDGFFPSDTRPPRLEEGTRTEAGLPETGFVFCAFNNAHKITPEMFAVWMRLLQNADGSVLWLNILNDTARANLRREAEMRGVSPKRLIFAPFEPLRPRHLARLRFADLHLDCLPYNAHSTAADMLQAGVPVLTCLGRAFAGRVAASLLTTLEMTDLIARDLGDYERIALELARSPERMAAVRSRLAVNRSVTATFDMARLAASIEQAYETMWQQYSNGAKQA